MTDARPSLPSSARRLRWLLALPKLGIVLLLASLLTLLWLTHQNEIDEDRATLIKDVLWLEQNIRFHLNGNEEQLQQLASDLGTQTDSKRLFQLRAAHLLKNNPEISQFLWFDANRKVIDALPTARLPTRKSPPLARR